MTCWAVILWGLPADAGPLLGASDGTGAGQVNPFSLARFFPPGQAGFAALTPGARDDEDSVGRAVRRRGFYAGEPVLAGDCAGCHADIAAQWQGSAHRFASFNNPYYAAAVAAYGRDRSPSAAGFCAGCHDPLLLVDDAISHSLGLAPGLLPGAPSRVSSPAAQAGLVCLVCHSIAAVPDRRGNGGYRLDATPVPASGASPSPHAARLRPAPLAQSEVCAACHKVGLDKDVTGDRWLRGQDDYDAWEQSLAGGNGVAAVYRDEAHGVRRCQDCHMPLLPSSSGKPVRSHRFLGANAALPHLRGDLEEEERTAAFLKDAVSLDVVVMRPGSDGGAVPDLPDLDERVEVSSQDPVLIDVVLRNRRVGHRFPGGTGDSNLAYVEVEAKALATGRVVRDTSHVLRAQPVDADGRPLLHRDVQHLRGVVYDTSLSPSDPQVVRYRLDPADLGLRGDHGAVQVRAWLRYRKFGPEYAAFACATLPATAEPAVRARCLSPPTLTVAEAGRSLHFSPRRPAVRRPATIDREARRGPTQPRQSEAVGTAVIDAKDGDARTGDSPAPPWQRYLDHGLGLTDGLVERAGEALPSLQRAADLAPGRAEPLLGLARLYLAQGRTQDVMATCQRADALRKDHPACLWLRGQAAYRAYQWRAALPPVERLAQLLPGDRNVLLLLSRVRGVLGDAGGALAAAERVLAIDPESEEGHYQRMLALRDLSRETDAQGAEQAYLRYRRPSERDLDLRARFRAAFPQLADEDTPAHVHLLRASRRSPSSSPWPLASPSHAATSR